MAKSLQLLYGRAPTLSVSRARALSTLGETLKAKERAEERLFTIRSEHKQWDQIRRAQEAARQLRKQMEEDIVLNGAMAELRSIQGTGNLSPELKEALAKWKAFGL